MHFAQTPHQERQRLLTVASSSLWRSSSWCVAPRYFVADISQKPQLSMHIWFLIQKDVGVASFDVWPSGTWDHDDQMTAGYTKSTSHKRLCNLSSICQQLPEYALNQWPACTVKQLLTVACNCTHTYVCTFKDKRQAIDNNSRSLQ